MSAPTTLALIVHAQQALGWSQRQLGQHLGVSKRTVSRWMARTSSIGADDVLLLARHVFPADAALAAQLAGRCGQSLQSLGLVAAEDAASATGASPTMTRSDLLDCVVCAVAEAHDLSPRRVRPMVMLALQKAHALGLDLAAVATMSAAPNAKDAPIREAASPE